MLTFQRETLDQAKAEAEPLLLAHWREIAHYQDIHYEPRWDVYALIEQSGNLRIYTARLDGTLIGYGAYALAPNMHYASSLEASEDVLYVSPEHRKGMVGLRLIKFCDAQLKLDYVQVVSRHVKAAHDHGPILERFGYELVDKIYKRRLDKD